MVKERRRDRNIYIYIHIYIYIYVERSGKERSWEKIISQMGRNIRNININYCNRSKMLITD